MSFGKLYGYAGNPRLRACQVAAKYEGHEVETVETNPFAEGGLDSSYLAKFPQGLVPAFEKGDFTLTEAVVIATYIAGLENKSGLVGANKEDAAHIQQWAQWANNQLLPGLGAWFMPLNGRLPYNKSNVESAKTKSLKSCDYLEKALATKTFLVGERISLADIFVASVNCRGFENVFDNEFQKSYPNIVRHFKTVVHQPEFWSALGATEPQMVEKAIQYTPPKKEAKPAAAPKAAAAATPKAAKPAKEEEDEPSAPAEPKAKHPCEALGPAKSFPLDEWKRQYSNNDTPVAFKWLEENFDPQEYSLWKATYKYPDELTQVFMSSNLVTGFHSRLEGSRKYLFGSSGVYGTNNNNKIVGVYMLRGSDHAGVFDVAPDWESYEFEPLDLKKDREFVLGCWSWENKIDGKDFQDGKVFK